MKFLKKEILRYVFKNFKKTYEKYKNEQIFEDFLYNANLENGLSSYLPYEKMFINYWIKYYLENKHSIKNKFEALNKNLDCKSIDLARRLFDRNVFLGFCKEIEDYTFFNKNKIFTKEEFEEQDKLKNYKQKYNNFPIEADTRALELYKQGFCYIEDKAMNYIKDKDFIDGGAYIGDSAIVFKELNPKRIFSFEPCCKNFNYLLETIKLNTAGNTIKPVNLGLGAECKKMSFTGDANYFNISSDELEANETIEITTLNKFSSENNLNIGLIKLDVEGVELDAVNGMLEIIKKDRPILLISIYHKPEDMFEIKPLLEQSVDNYKYLIRSTYFECLNTEFMLIAFPEELDINAV